MFTLIASALLVAAPVAPPVPADEVAYLEEVFVLHATTLSNVTEFAYVACDAEWNADGSITGQCFGMSGSQILVSLVVHTATDVSIIPVGLYTWGEGWNDPALTVTAEGAPLPAG